MIKPPDYFVNDDEYRLPRRSFVDALARGHAAQAGRCFVSIFERWQWINWKECAERGERKRSTTSTAAG